MYKEMKICKYNIGDMAKMAVIYGKKPYSRVIFKARLKVRWQPKYQTECYIPKCWSCPEVNESAMTSGHCWCGLRNPRWRTRWLPEINARGCCI